jgi:DNA helicase TIP49 (TBP-interacting protein)
VSADGLFADPQQFPDEGARERYEQLVGIDAIKLQLVGEAQALLDPSVVERWSKRAHGALIPAVRDVMDRTALVILAGDVGTGKTELAETVGDPIARSLKTKVTMFPLNLSARGHGAVGEMTTLLTRAFERPYGSMRGQAVAGTAH